MSIVCPVELRVQYNLEKTFYFTKTVAASAMINLKNEKKEEKKMLINKMEDENDEQMNKRFIKN